MRPLFITLLIIFISSYSFAQTPDELSEFEKFKQQEQREFDKYMKEIQKEFEEYKRIVDEEFRSYKNEISKYWDKPEISDKKKWVEYSPDFQTKRVVDFEKGYIEVDIITDKDEKGLEKKIGHVLKDMIMEDKQTAFKRDKLSQNIENKITKAAKHIKTDKVERKPILAPVVLGKSKPSNKELNRAVIDMLKDGKIEKGKVRPKKKNKEIVTLKVNLPSKGVQIKAAVYKSSVDKYANKNDLDTSLVYAIIHTESYFNPMAKSPVPAYGLMQIVPSSAGKDATQHIYGKAKLLSPSFLYNDDNNIMIGAAYLYILYYKYLKAIKNPESRLYCSIAAYNTGAGNVARAFTGKRNINKAASVINSMSPKKVYNTLIKKLPYDETRHYLKRVSGRIDKYKTL